MLTGPPSLVIEHEIQLIPLPVRQGHIEAGQPQGLEADIQEGLAELQGGQPWPQALQGSQEEIPVLVQVAHQLLGAVQPPLEGPELALQLGHPALPFGQRIVLGFSAEETHLEP